MPKQAPQAEMRTACSGLPGPSCAAAAAAGAGGFSAAAAAGAGDTNASSMVPFAPSAFARAISAFRFALAFTTAPPAAAAPPPSSLPPVLASSAAPASVYGQQSI